MAISPTPESVEINKRRKFVGESIRDADRRIGLPKETVKLFEDAKAWKTVINAENPGNVLLELMANDPRFGSLARFSLGRWKAN